MAIAYRASAAGTNASRSSFTLTIPAAAQVGDRAIISMELDSSRVITPPAGWRAIAAAGTVTFAYAWEHEVAAGEPGTATGSFTWTTADFSCPMIDVWSGTVSGTNALSGTPSSSNGSGTGTATCTSITTLDADAMVVFLAVNPSDLAASSAAGTERNDTTH
jgi:hypothetical protein